ncbi:MAG TPA: catalase family peroxidase [Solirubrobacteraceae bacterium]|nr:catalase family peroxidase [Solirubrobacteraceae bacterium]
MTSPSEAVDATEERFGLHPGSRKLHAKGTLLRGTFTPTPAAARLSRAVHLQGGPVPLTARVSNASGDPTEPDYRPDIRGLAVKLYLPDGRRTDIVAQTAHRFPVSDPAGFNDLLRASKPPAAAWRLPMFLARHPQVVRDLPRSVATMAPPVSYATRRYHALHAFRWVDAAGHGTYVRYDLVPEAGERALSPLDARRRGPNYLRDEILQRVARGPVRFRLELQVAEPGDEVDDPGVLWPAERERLDAGTVLLTGPDTEREQDGDVLVFDPTRVVDGIELSDDPVLHFRSQAYSESVLRRTGRTRPERLA